MDYYRVLSISWLSEFENSMTTLARQPEQAQSIVIIGIGQSGLSCARFLVNKGYTVAMMDTREQPPALATLQSELPEVLITTGGLDEHLMHQASMIVLSPGVDPRQAEIVTAKQANIELVGDIELFARVANAPVIAITGSNGKSTVTTLLAAMADESGQHIQVGGNLGTPALDLIVKPSPDFYILELSSFQLETVKSLNAFVATVLNVSPDHLDRYDCEQDYIDAKATIFNGDGVMVLNSDDPHVMQLARDGRNQIQFSLEASDGVNFGLAEVDGNIWLAEGKQVLLPVDELMIKGKHNVANALAALAIGSAMGLSMSAMVRALKTYPGLPHRCRLVKEINNVRWFNDSKATNVGACVAAIEGLADSGKMILIAGGVGKDQDFSELTAVLKSHVREIIVLGHDAELIAKEAPAEVTVHRVATLKEAVSVAYQVARAGEIVLLSPACASFDMFSGYAERGEKFETLVREIS